MTRKTALVLAALVALNLIVFAQTLGHQFVNYDDGQYVFENPHVKKGLTGESIRWALTSTELGYYPLTWLSHMLDVELFDLNPRAHHATAVLLHILSTVVLYFALRRLTGSDLRSAVVAALFAIHPMHVESVAWVSERKDTLSTLFGMLALAAYPQRKIVVALAFAASLASKQMLVTLPFVLLLIDFWPLRRRDWKRAVIEKIPLFALTIAGAVLAVIGQRQLEAMQTTEVVSMSDRLQNALFAYAAYVGKLLWPANLAVLYPFEPVSGGEAAIGLVVVAALVALAVFAARRGYRPLFTGIFWFLGTLVPVIGIVHIGAHSMADRYTYFPYIGLFIALVWGLSDLADRLKLPEGAPAIVAALAIAVCTAVAWKQTTYWRNSETLFTRTIAVTGPNAIMEYSLGQSLQLTEPDRALTHLRCAIEIVGGTRNPFVAQFHTGVGTALLMKARSERDATAAVKLIDEAAAAYNRAIEIDPAGSGNARRNLALAAEMKRQVRPAETAAEDAQISALFDSGLRSLAANDFEAAIATFRRAMDLDPAAVDARIYLALTFMRAQRNAEALQQLEEARQLDPERANRYVTRALRMPEGANNLDALIARLR